MGKLKKLVVILLLLVVIVAAAGHFFSGSVLKAAVEKGGTEGLGTEVRVASASLWAPSSTASLRGVEIANLDGFTKPNLLDAAGIDVEVSVSSLLGEPVTIGTITLTEPVFTLEATLTSTNLTKLLAQLDKGEAGGTTAPEAEATSGEKPTELKIDLVRIVAPKVILVQSAWGRDEEVVDLATIEIRDLGTADGKDTTTMAGLMQRITVAILEAVATKNKIPKELIAVLKSDLGNLAILGDVLGGIEEIGTGVGEAVQGAGKVLEGIFGGDKKDN